MKKNKNSRALFKVWGICVVLVIVGFYGAYRFVGPAPTKNIVIATGGKGGAYHQFGLKYADRFKNDGVELTVLETAGSIDNLSKLVAKDNNVHAALIQGGIGSQKDFPMLESLGSMYHEPLWLFHSKKIPVETLGDLSSASIVLGKRGSGTYALSTLLLAANGVTAETAQFLETNGEDGRDALLSGRADALFIVAGINSDDVRRLLENSNVKLYSFHRADAYARNFKYLFRVILPEGSVNLNRNIPDREIALIAPAANLIIRNDLHPALMFLFMMAAEDVHRQGGLLEPEGVFPSPLAVGFPLNKEAKRFYQSGPPFLIRILPFGIATWLVRMFVLVIPLVTVLYPLLKLAPPTYKWRLRRKVRKVYKALHQLEEDIAGVRNRQDLERLRHRVEQLKNRAESMHVPVSQLEAQYFLRRHIEFVQERLERRVIPETTDKTQPDGRGYPPTIQRQSPTIIKWPP